MASLAGAIDALWYCAIAALISLPFIQTRLREYAWQLDIAFGTALLVIMLLLILRPSASTDQASQTLGQNIYWPIIKNDLVGHQTRTWDQWIHIVVPSFGGVRTISSPSPVIALTTITSLGCGTL